MPDDLFGRRETVIQREVANQGFPAPAVRLAGDSNDGLGRPYMLMDRSQSVPLMSGLTAGRAIGSIPRLARLLPRLLASTALELHLLDPAPVADALRAEVPDAPVDTNDMLQRLSDAAQQLAVPHLLHATKWLAANQPTAVRVCVCHGIHDRPRHAPGPCLAHRAPLLARALPPLIMRKGYDIHRQACPAEHPSSPSASGEDRVA